MFNLYPMVDTLRDYAHVLLTAAYNKKLVQSASHFSAAKSNRDLTMG